MSASGGNTPAGVPSEWCNSWRAIESRKVREARWVFFVVWFLTFVCAHYEYNRGYTDGSVMVWIKTAPTSVAECNPIYVYAGPAEVQHVAPGGVQHVDFGPSGHFGYTTANIDATMRIYTTANVDATMRIDHNGNVGIGTWSTKTGDVTWGLQDTVPVPRGGSAR